jgi:hypothetical protein
MSSPTPILDSSSERLAYALKVFGGQVLTAYRQSTLFHDMRQTFCHIKSVAGRGKSEEFPLAGIAPEAETHLPGNELLGQQQPFGNVSVAIDDAVVSHRSVPGDESLLSHFDWMPTYTNSIAWALAKATDDKIVRMAVKAARTAALAGFHNGGHVVSRVGGGSSIAAAYPESSTGAANLITDMRIMSRMLDEADVPAEGRACILSSYGKSVLQHDNTGAIFSRDYQDRNQLVDRRIGRAEGFDIYHTNSLPTTNVVGAGSLLLPNKYDVDCRYVAGNVAAGTGQPVAVVLCGSQSGTAALGMATAEEMFTHMKVRPELFDILLIGRNMLGVDKTNVWCAGEIRGQLS